MPFVMSQKIFSSKTPHTSNIVADQQSQRLSDFSAEPLTTSQLEVIFSLMWDFKHANIL